MSGVDAGVDVPAWQAELERVEALVGGRFGRAQPRRWAGAYLRGLLAPLERTNGWMLAEDAGAVSPEGMPRLVRTAGGDAEAVRDDLRGYGVAELGDPGGSGRSTRPGSSPRGCARLGWPGRTPAPPARSTTARGVVLSSLTRAGDRALIGRELSRLTAWPDDRARCRAAGSGDDGAVATTPELARRRLERAVAAGLPFGGVTVDEAHGQHRALRRGLNTPACPP